MLKMRSCDVDPIISFPQDIGITVSDTGINRK